MKIKLIKLSTLIFTFFLLCSFKNEQTIPPYKDSSLPVEQRISDLLQRMTVEEKIKQLDMYWGKEISSMKKHECTEADYSLDSLVKYVGTTSIGSVHDFYPANAKIINRIQKYAVRKTRLGIPILFIEEGLHGYEGFGSTSFPVPIAMASTWDTVSLHNMGNVVATESRAHGIGMILGPVLCLPRDPRWGRVEETYGEDPYLSAEYGVTIVKAMQGNNLKNPNAVIAEPKHFAVHGIPEAGSNTAPVNIGEREARSSFLYVFEKAVREGNAQGIMAAYSEIDGIPCVDNKWLLTDVLRNEWGFNGFVLSDLGAIRMSLENHKIADNISDALTQTFKAGMNMQFYDFPHDVFLLSMKEVLDNHSLSTADLDKAVHDVLRIKFLLGLFDNPYIDETLISTVFHSQEHQAMALDAAQKSICLLKNDNYLLPFNNSIRSVAVIGELATSTYLGGYSNKEGKAISILDGLKQKSGNHLQIGYEKGYSYKEDASPSELIQKAVNLAKASDIAVVVVGENIEEVGEGKDRAHLDLDETQMNLIQAIQKTGKPVVAILSNGRPLCINWIAENIPSVLETWFLGETSGLAIADVLLGNVNPSGKLPMTFPRSTGQIPFYYNNKPTSSHRYVDEESTPLFPFGHGLSYTTFEYSNLKITPAQIPINGEITVTVTIKNTGTVEGTEVVQLYIRDEVSSVTTPIKSLKGFSRVNLKPGEGKKIGLTLNSDALSLWNREMKRVVEPGDFKIMVGSSSNNIRQEGVLTVK